MTTFQIQEERENMLLNRRELNGLILFEGATPSRYEMKLGLAKQLKIDPELVVIKKVRNVFGERQVLFRAYVYKSKKALENISKVLLKKSKAPEKKEEGKEAEKQTESTERTKAEKASQATAEKQDPKEKAQQEKKSKEKSEQVQQEEQKQEAKAESKVEETSQNKNEKKQEVKAEDVKEKQADS